MAEASGLQVPMWAWLLFAAIIAASLVIDLIAHRGNRAVSRTHAIGWSVGWIVVALLFGGWVAIAFGPDIAQDYLSAYLVEKSLSVDNLFVFLVIFGRLRIPEGDQHRVLFWGIFGALVSRAILVALGATLLARWHGLMYVLGAFLVYTGWRTARAHGDGATEGKVLSFFARHLRMTPRLHGHRFVVQENGRRVGTPLLLALLAIEATDIAFAVDSVPAVFAISQEPFIVYSSNVFAILGLRALYLVLADLLQGLKYLKYGLAAILVLAGVKMLISGLVHVPPAVSLGSIVFILAATIIPSVIVRRRDRRQRA